MQETCPCDKRLPYAECCEPFHRGAAQPATASDLMRARYSAFVKHEIDYLRESLAPKHRAEFNRKEIEDWSRNSEWQGLTLGATELGGPGDATGTVEFTARFRSGDEDRVHEELATFVKVDGKWLFDESKVPPVKQVRNAGPKVGRNDPCPCGSGKKYKKCHGA